MKTTFRFPGSAEYSYAEVSTTEGGVTDNLRELRDVDDNFLNAVGDVLRRGCAVVVLSELNPTIVGQQSNQQWNDPANAPQWAQNAPQEAQGYSQAPYTQQGGYPPQNGYQAPQGAYQTQVVPQQPNNPPGQMAPVCQYHQQPAEYKPAGTSKRTGKPYSAFWACAAGDNNCTKASNFPRA